MTILETAVSRSRKLRPRTKELYLQHVRTFLTFAGSAKAHWTSDSVTAWRDDMRSRGIRPESVNVALNALRYAAQSAGCKFVDGVDRLPARRQRSEDSEEGRALTWSEGRKLVDTCNGTKGRDLRDRAIITLGLRTGMLRFSMCQLKFEDLRRKTLTFVKKGGETHTITLDDVTYAALRAWTSWLSDHDKEDGFIFRSLGRQRVSPKDEVAIGDQLTPDGLYRALRERAREAGFEDIRPHVFRKTFLAWAKSVGAKPLQIEAVTGHKSDGVGGEEEAATPPANLLLPAWDERLK